MKAADLKFNLIDSYLALLNNLSPESKLELISKLSDSLKGSKKPTNKSISDLYGAFISKKSADEIITDLKRSRQFNRKTELF
jgi:predicted metal-binding transcription factor (methanogenesis marker protein 9)